MSYQDKYIKYKNKYINLKNQLGGEPAKLLYHGTSSYYFESIKANGLPGKFPEDLYESMKTLYDAGYGNKQYIEWFFNRQKELDEGISNLSLTGQLPVAIDYTKLKGGEGLSQMVSNAKGKSLNTHLQSCLDKLIKVQTYPGIILVVKVEEIKDLFLTGEKMPEQDVYEIKMTKKIPPEKLYIRKDNGIIVNILSQEANIFIENIILNAFERKDNITVEFVKNTIFITIETSDDINIHYECKMLFSPKRVESSLKLKIHTENIQELSKQIEFINNNDKIKKIQKTILSEKLKEIIFNEVKRDRVSEVSSKLKEIFNYLENIE